MNVFRLELRNLRKSALVGTFFLGLVIALMLAFFPAMQTDSMQALAGAKMDGISPLLLKALGLADILDFSVISHYFGYVIQFVGLAIMIVIVQQATSLFIKEETDGTIEFLAAKPVSRSDIFLQKSLAHLASVVGLSMVLWLITLIGYLAVSDYAIGAALYEVSIIYLAILFVSLIYSSIGFLLSTVVKSSKSASGIAMGIVFGTYILGMLSSIVPDLGILVWLSPLDWIKTEKLLREGIRLGEAAAGLAALCVFTVAAWFCFRRKDLLI